VSDSNFHASDHKSKTALGGKSRVDRLGKSYHAISRSAWFQRKYRRLDGGTLEVCFDAFLLLPVPTSGFKLVGWVLVSLTVLENLETFIAEPLALRLVPFLYRAVLATALPLIQTIAVTRISIRIVGVQEPRLPVSKLGRGWACNGDIAHPHR